MTTTEMKNAARTATIDLLSGLLNENNAIQFGDASFAIAQEIDGETIWTEISVKAKNNKATKISPAFDPTATRYAWLEDKAAKAAAKEAKKREKGE